MRCLTHVKKKEVNFSPISVPSMRFVFSAVLSMTEKTHKKLKNKNLKKIIKKKNNWLLLTGCFVSMFLVCTFSVFILTVQFNLGGEKGETRKKKTIKDKDILGKFFSVYVVPVTAGTVSGILTLTLSKSLELCSLSHCSILKKKAFLWFSQWWQRSLSYLNGFYHFLFLLILY